MYGIGYFVLGDTFMDLLKKRYLNLKFTHFKEDIFINQRSMVTRITKKRE